VEHLYHFDLTQDPFQNEPDLRFFCQSETHRRAQLRIDRALRLSGHGGTGKSLLARRLFEELEEEVFEASLLVMMQGTADAVSVLRRFATDLGLEDPPSSRAGLIGALYEQMAIVREDGRHAVLIIDDAHVLGRDAMAEIAGLLNLEYEDRRLVSLLLVGMPELDEIVASVPSLCERVDVRVPLAALGEAESIAYLSHRIEAASGSPRLFEEGALKAIYTLGGGRPRRMNALADNALFEAFLAGRKQVDEGDVRSANADLAFETAAPAIAPQGPAAASAVAVSVPAPPTPESSPASEAFDMPEAFAAATELAMESLDSSTEGLSLSDDDLFEPSPGATADAANDSAEATMLIDGLVSEDPAGLSSGGLDLASLLGDDSPGGDASASFAGMSDPGSTLGELELDTPIPPESPMGDSFPDFAASPAASPMAEATRIALPDDLGPAEGFVPSETTDSDEIDDLFVELLDD